MLRHTLLFVAFAIAKTIALTTAPPQAIYLATNLSQSSSSRNTHPRQHLITNLLPPSLVSGPVLNISTSLTNRAHYECDKEDFGQPSVSSCVDAYAQIPAGHTVYTYRDRNGEGAFDVPLPQRYVSRKYFS